MDSGKPIAMSNGFDWNFKNYYPCVCSGELLFLNKNNQDFENPGFSYI